MGSPKISFLNEFVLCFALLAFGASFSDTGKAKEKLDAMQEAKIVALEKRIADLENKLLTLSQTVVANKAKFDEVVSSDKRWLGQNSGLVGPQGPVGAQGPRGPGAVMPYGPDGFVEFRTEENNVLHIGPGGICLYAPNGQRWCR